MTAKRSLMLRLETLERNRVKPSKVFFWQEEHEPTFDPDSPCAYWETKIQKYCDKEQIVRASAQVVCFRWMDDNDDPYQTTSA